MNKTFKFNSLKLVLFIFFLPTIQHFSAAKPTNNEAMVKAMEWQQQHPIFASAPTDWTNGVYYLGMTKAYQATKDPKYLAAIKAFGYENKWKPNIRTYHADDITIAYSYIFASTTRSEVVDLEPTKKWIDTHLYEPNQWKNSTKPQTSIMWWWCDALFMAPPVIAFYAKVTKNQTYLDEMHKYYLETYNLLFDKEDKLFARDLRYVIKGNSKDLKEKNGKKVFWARGNGWVLGGLAVLLEDMPKDYKYYSFYEELFKTMAKSVKDIQPKDGLWRVSLLYPEGFEHGEVSGSGLFTYALAWGINNGLLSSDEYKPAVLKAWKAMRKCQLKDGMVGWVQDIGDSPKPASSNSWQNFGTGAYLLAGSEVVKLK